MVSLNIAAIQSYHRLMVIAAFSALALPLKHDKVFSAIILNVPHLYISMSYIASV